MRTLFVPVILSLFACNPPEGKDHTTLLIDLDPLEDGSAASAMGVLVTVDETARTYDNEVEVTIGGLFQADATMDIRMTVLEGASEVASGFRRSSDDNGNAVWSPDFDACDGAGYELQADGSCAYGVAVLVVSDRVHSLLMGFDIRA